MTESWIEEWADQPDLRTQITNLSKELVDLRECLNDALTYWARYHPDQTDLSWFRDGYRHLKDANAPITISLKRQMGDYPT